MRGEVGMQKKPGNPVPANDNEPPATSVGRRRSRMQACLQCGHRFRSEGPFHRICDSCKTDEAWQSGEDMTLALPPRRQMVE